MSIENLQAIVPKERAVNGVKNQNNTWQCRVKWIKKLQAIVSIEKAFYSGNMNNISMGSAVSIEKQQKHRANRKISIFQAHGLRMGKKYFL